MNQNRGFHFLAGLAVLWLIWRFYARGIFFASVQYCTGQDICFGGPEVQVYGGPGAIVVAAVIEFIITAGWVFVLVVCGIWDGLVILGRFVSDGFGVAHQYLKGAQVEASAAPAAPTADARQLTPEQSAIEELSKQVVALAAKLEAK
jgi:hypothetical protein